MLNYVGIKVTDVARSAAYYDAVLGPLGWRRQSESDSVIGWGLVKPVFFVSDGQPQTGFGEISFPGNSIPAVKAAWEAGLEHGGEDRDEPGSTPLRGPGSYSARMLDPDGYTIEISVAPQ
jgi:catechol 2,3-dioxygenase-like lactoylglutathione lyase family enzyme